MPRSAFAALSTTCIQIQRPSYRVIELAMSSAHHTVTQADLMSDSSSDSQSESVHHITKPFRFLWAATGCTLVTLFVAASTDSRKNITSQPQTVRQLLSSNIMSEQVELMAVRAVQAGASFVGKNADDELPLFWRHHASRAARMHFDSFVAQLTSEQDDSLLSHVIDDNQTKSIMQSMQALTDSRLVNMGMDIARACKHYPSEKLGWCTLKHLSARSTEVRQLREELLPVALQSLSEPVKTEHLNFLHNRGMFGASAELSGWHAELEYKKRVLQEQTLQTSLIPTSFESSPPSGRLGGSTPVNWFTVGAPIASTAFNLMFLSLISVLPGKGGLPHNRPVNYGLWGTQFAGTLGECLANVGFPTGIVYFASCGIDVMFLAVEVIWVFFDGQQVGRQVAPGKEDDCVSYTAWSNLTGVCGNCMATTTSQPGWTSCASYCESFGHKCKYAGSAVRRSCVARGTYKCDEYIPIGTEMFCQCEFSKRKAKKISKEFAELLSAKLKTEKKKTKSLRKSSEYYSEDSATKIVKIEKEDDSQSIAFENGTTDMINIDTKAPIVCSSYTSWPEIQGAVCGQCRALVPPARNTPRSCQSYCESFNHTCISAALSDTNSCEESRPMECNPETDDFEIEVQIIDNPSMLCTCSKEEDLSPPDFRCGSYPQWPSIEVNVCGNCTAAVTVNNPLRKYPTCESFCSSFDHVCEKAAVAISSTKLHDACIKEEEKEFGCMNSTEGYSEVLCTCVLKQSKD